MERFVRIGQLKDPASVHVKSLEHDVKADVAIVGGGALGLSAAQAFLEKGRSVVLLEKNFCGSGATGKSSGFITPDSEFHLRSFADRYGVEKAQRLWEFATSGVEHIKKNIEIFGIECNYFVQDTLVVAISPEDYHNQIKPENAIREKLGYKSTLYPQPDLPNILGSNQYFGGVRYPDTFGINGFYYAQGMKNVLESKGVRIYEETPAVTLEPNHIRTPHGSVSADQMVLATDRFIPKLHKLTYDIYCIQTYLMMSEPLRDEDIKAIFPNERFLVWDTQLLYTYYRMADNNRLMLGGSSVVSTYAGREWPHNPWALRKSLKYFRQKFPSLRLKIEHSWPGLLGISKDFMPIAGRDKKDPSLYVVGAATGLPWSVALGRYAADVLVDGRSDLDEFFSPDRPFSIGHTVQNLIGTRAAFALSHLINTPNKLKKS